MKKVTLICLILNSFIAGAQELASDYFVPSIHGNKKFMNTSVYSLTGDLAEIPTTYSSSEIEVLSQLNDDGTLGYKFTFTESSFLLDKTKSYFVKFNGNSAKMYGFSKHENKSLLSYGGSTNEIFENSEETTIWKVPNESYQTVDLSYQDPFLKKQIEVTSSYKKYTVNGYEQRMLVIEYKNGNQKRTEIYMKHYGLIAVKNFTGAFQIADLSSFKFYNSEDIKKMPEKDLRNLAWKHYNYIKTYEFKDSFFLYNNKENVNYFKCIDTIMSLYDHMMILYPNARNGNQFVLSIQLHHLIGTVTDASKKENKTIQYSKLSDLAVDYFTLRPTVESISKTDLSKFITNSENSYYNTYWKMVYLYFSYKTSSTYIDKSYKAMLMKPFVNQIVKYESKLDDVNKCILYSYVANYYYNLGEESNRFLYIAKSIEYYPKLSQTEKDLNIEYMRNVMKILSTGQPANEADLNRAMGAVLNLKDYTNVIKIAENGQNIGVGKSKDFAFVYAEAAYADEINKVHLRKAMDILKNNVDLMSSKELIEYVKYCNALQGEYDCKKAQSMVQKAKDKEESEREKKAKEDRKRSRTSNGKRFLNLAVMANPLAGLNVGTSSDGMFKFLPMSAALRTGKLVHEVRYNPFFGGDFKNRFIFGKTSNSDIDNNDKWKNLRGADYSYELVFVKNEFSSYRKTCNSMGGGFQILYGEFTSNPESVAVRVNNLNATTTISPKIVRYEGIINFNFFLFNWKNHLSATLFYGVGAGKRSITYNSNLFSESTLQDDTKTEFFDKRLIQDNWKGAYITFRGGFRFGFTIF